MNEGSALLLKTIVLVIIIVMASVSGFLETILFRPFLPGVVKGDVFYYTMYASYTSDKTDARVSVPPFESNNTEWLRIEILEVEGTKIWHSYILRFINGSERQFTAQTDIYVNVWDQVRPVFRGLPILAADLNVGDPIPSIHLVVNETVGCHFFSCERIANHVTWLNDVEFGDCYFDRRTGMLLFLHREHQFTNLLTGETITKTDVVELKNASLRKSETFIKLNILQRAPL